jgi:hypothetical protein
MNIIEQQVWEYLDGTCSMQERKNLAQLIDSDPVYRAAYNELKSLQEDLSKLDLDEPSMGFTRDVMTKVAALPVPGSIKSLVDKRIIYGIAAIFLVSLITLLALSISQIEWAKPVTASLLTLELPKMDYTSYFNSTYLQVFFFVDLVLGLYLLDSVLRKKMLAK